MTVAGAPGVGASGGDEGGGGDAAQFGDCVEEDVLKGKGFVTVLGGDLVDELAVPVDPG